MRFHEIEKNRFWLNDMLEYVQKKIKNTKVSNFFFVLLGARNEQHKVKLVQIHSSTQCNIQTISVTKKSANQCLTRVDG